MAQRFIIIPPLALLGKIQLEKPGELDMDHRNMPEEYRIDIASLDFLQEFALSMGKQRDVTSETLVQWSQDKRHPALLEQVSNYPPRALLTAPSKSLLFYLTRVMRPEAICEIGSYWGGTMELLARALYFNGMGVIHSVDPYGSKSIPHIISQWPQSLQQHVAFHGETSQLFFEKCLNAFKVFDFIFIDGNHDYEFVQFDLLCAAKIVRPNGLIIMDNVEQPGPRIATLEFLEKNPDWTLLGADAQDNRNLEPFADALVSFPGTGFFIIKSPPYYQINSNPRNFGHDFVDVAALDSIGLKLAKTTDLELYVQAFLRGFKEGVLPTMEWVEFKHRLAGDTLEVNIALPEPLAAGNSPGDGWRYKIEVLFATRHPGENLLLLEPPQYYP